MRIIGGEWRRRALVAPKGETTRPTADRVRETLFNMLASRIGAFEELRVADLFAGSGALGLEALSRGAAHCLFVERDSAALKALHANITALGAIERADVIAESVLRLGPTRTTTDLIMLDPPYGTRAGQVALERLIRLGWIGPASWIALETGRAEEVGVGTLETVAERRCGPAKITLLRSFG